MRVCTTIEMGHNRTHNGHVLCCISCFCLYMFLRSAVGLCLLSPCTTPCTFLSLFFFLVFSCPFVSIYCFVALLLLAVFGFPDVRLPLWRRVWEIGLSCGSATTTTATNSNNYNNSNNNKNNNVCVVSGGLRWSRLRWRKCCPRLQRSSGTCSLDDGNKMCPTSRRARINQVE